MYCVVKNLEVGSFYAASCLRADDTPLPVVGIVLGAGEPGGMKTLALLEEIAGFGILGPKTSLWCCVMLALAEVSLECYRSTGMGHLP